MPVSVNVTCPCCGSANVVEFSVGRQVRGSTCSDCGFELVTSANVTANRFHACPICGSTYFFLRRMCWPKKCRLECYVCSTVFPGLLIAVEKVGGYDEKEERRALNDPNFKAWAQRVEEECGGPPLRLFSGLGAAD